MITFLTSPKPFYGHTGRIQKKAIQSWLRVAADVEVLVYGEGEGVAEACKDLGTINVPDIECSLSGIPLFNSIVNHAKKNAKHDIQCYLNCDILLNETIADAVKIITKAKLNEFLVTGQRIDLMKDVDFELNQHWLGQLKQLFETCKLQLHSPTGMDYFIFRRGMWNDLPALVIGRAGYDEALVLYCMRNKIPIINGTLKILALHQFHDYGHTSNGRKEVVRGQDALNNFKFHRNFHSRPNSSDAELIIMKDKVLKNNIHKDPIRRAENYLRFEKGFERLSLSIRFLWRILVSIGFLKMKSFKISELIANKYVENE
ncbi:hypothetical protein L21SP3_00958 [Sedimentisphaera cyanobacteriorum]|uniref:Glycosyl transferase family 2 n=1 Tax=Sedimentisphaera cyanobacteriorum TaxID=1940790 RepID=A0A1Q2HNW3_9BACT|nr:hypothetical protein [Sedimentisphaera cyanobacteriorum]AQQ09158.1 hypothetical protein L21SP3_00958 [Sedimentisphaera cyanobacteriorum]